MKQSRKRFFPPHLAIVAIVAFSPFIFGSFSGCAARRSDLSPHPPEKITSAAATDGQLEAGAATADITPEHNVYMAGFGILRRSRGVHDPLEVRAVVLKKGNVKIALVSMDLIGVMKPDLDSYREKIKGFDGNDIIIVAATHTHSAPDTMGYWGGVDDQYKQRLGAAVKDAVERADASAVPVKMLVGSGAIPDGAIKNFRQTDLLDLRVGILQFVPISGGNPVATIVNYACHPEVMWGNNHQISADYVGVIRRELEKDGDGTVVFFNGALGAMVTPDVWPNEKRKYVHTFAEVDRIAAIMLRGVRPAISSAKPIETMPFKWVRIEFPTPVDNPIFKRAAKLGIFDRQVYEPNDVLTETAAVRIGDAIIVAVPGEARPDIGMKLKDATGTEHPFFIGLANDELGYILPEDAFTSPFYAYERTMSTGAESDAQIVTNALRAIDMVK